MSRRDWITIEKKAQKTHLRTCVSELKSKWPGRYEFRIEPDKVLPLDEKRFSLLLRHR